MGCATLSLPTFRRLLAPVPLKLVYVETPLHVRSTRLAPRDGGATVVGELDSLAMERGARGLRAIADKVIRGDVDQDAISRDLATWLSSTPE